FEHGRGRRDRLGGPCDQRRWSHGCLHFLFNRWHSEGTVARASGLLYEPLSLGSVTEAAAGNLAPPRGHHPTREVFMVSSFTGTRSRLRLHIAPALSATRVGRAQSAHSDCGPDPPQSCVVDRVNRLASARSEACSFRQSSA